ncbi:MAG TPA: macro domain-containing protein [Burkholderiales bacterium]|nr:macro domain-containing protein [Burkholderiales bacterium]
MHLRTAWRTNCAKTGLRCIKIFGIFVKANTPSPAVCGHGWALTANASSICVRRIPLITPAKPPDARPMQHVGHALKALRQMVETEKLTSVAFPRLATGVGGLQWHDVKPLLEQNLGDLQIPVIVYTTFHAGQAAAEGL